MPRSRAPVVAALATLYVVWSSTYLAMRIAARTLPPMTLGAVRFLVAGAVLYGVLRLRGAPRPSGVQWRAGALAGTLLLVGGLGGAASVATRVPSGLVALMFGSVPIWVTVLDRIVPQRGGASAGPLAARTSPRSRWARWASSSWV